ncbi:tRNA/tmRNA/rRNA uracil-C5-methylase (TrmA/RlmC/RlmD family) [Brooklawnia cerclae]|uniref:tRNA/tmRNA/rRNA uracil-C5-methylase (TrmA/RlmC/RlmD family) n=1 Tax=Brooklawnia cerclae TaxID=349934 RepID=A0ABX0SEW9_9ACTN|nr:tRNA/tmRNA/rRNA uracil-C5-methylase (TrmA/RlmC/RlmD family) [Brooklawnia cerclae]
MGTDRQARATEPPAIVEGAVAGPIEVGPIAHGGHCVARLDGRVVFVRHALPGETVTVRITDTSHERFWWADAATVIAPSPDRVSPPCPIAGVCGGCDFQHVRVDAQRGLKADVVAEQLSRLAGIHRSVTVEAVPGDDGGLGWRTRMRYLLADGRVGMRAWRSGRLVPLPDGGCLLARPEGRDEPFAHTSETGELQVVVASSGMTVLRDGEVLAGKAVVEERASGRAYKVRADGFWQVHPGAADALVEAVMAGLRPETGEHAIDLYCGVGLFAGALVDAGCRVTGVESDRAAVELARGNVPEARFHTGRVERTLGRLPRRADLVVLDPPRTGARAAVVRHVVGLGARRIAYVACDPAALARDLATFADEGYELASLRAFDLFPMTHHIECVAILTPAVRES